MQRQLLKCDQGVLSSIAGKPALAGVIVQTLVVLQHVQNSSTGASPCWVCVQIFGLAPEALPHDVERLPLDPAQGGSDVSRRFNALLECVLGRCFTRLKSSSPSATPSATRT
jgi:hypothetical protein